MENIVKIAAVGICGTILLLTLKKQNLETALVLILAISALLLTAVLPVFSNIKVFIDDLTDKAGLSSAVIVPIFKILGIAIVTKIGAGICEDCDAKAIGSCIEISGAVGAVYVSLPLFSSALKLITSFI